MNHNAQGFLNRLELWEFFFFQLHESILPQQI